MYIPRRYEEKDKGAVLEFIREHSFAILISVSDGKPIGTHIPLLVREEGEDVFLIGHISKGNEQKHSLSNGATVMAIFPGPHAYISPRWYTEMNVPTWNYLSVHAYGEVTLMEGPALEQALSELVNHFEQHMSKPVTVGEIPEKTYQDDLRGIVGFSIKVSEWQAAAKLSQNRDDESYRQVIKELQASPDQSAQAVASAMLERRKEIE